jgi:hypothetical protein
LNARFEVLTVVKLPMVVFSNVKQCGRYVGTSISEEHNASIFKAEIYICLWERACILHCSYENFVAIQKSHGETTQKTTTDNRNLSTNFGKIPEYQIS